MGKKKYRSPIILTLEPGEDPNISFGGSQGTSGNDSQWTFSFSGISDYDLDMIELNCDDLDLQDMDANGDYVITDSEFQGWLAARGGW
ncbi:MAG: hypothetical protein K6F23_15090 [Solobacterium sp.]|nr:hypothetical protein [Solobacterium sp.]